MFWEYAQWLGFSPESPITFDFIKEACIVVGSGLLLGFSPESPITFDFIKEACIVVGSGLLLVFAGFKVKGTLGAALALLFGALLYLFLNVH
jgi:hypothetical protein